MRKSDDTGALLANASRAAWRTLAGAMVLAAGAAQGQGPPGTTAGALLGQARAAAQPALPSAVAAADDEVQTVIVRPDAFAESDRKLDQLIKGLPGADDAVPVQRDLADRVGDYFAARRDPNALDAGTQRTLLKSFEPASNNP